MTWTRQELGISLKRLRQQRHDLVAVRALTSDPDHLKKLNQIMEVIQYLETNRLELIKKCAH